MVAGGAAPVEARAGRRLGFGFEGYRNQADVGVSINHQSIFFWFPDRYKNHLIIFEV